MIGNTIELVLVCYDPPPAEHEGQPCEFGMQDAHQVLHPGEALPDGNVCFTCDVTVKARRDGSPDLAGRFVQGPGGGRFLYLGWRTLGGVAWIRRYKIPLTPITAELLDAHTLHAAVSTATRAATLPFRTPWTPA